MSRSLDLHVNGERLHAFAEDQASLLEVLRLRLGLTGSKQGCDKGDCGACAVLLDGKPALACCTLAHTATAAEITTIEGLANADGPSVLQRAFDVEGALQCGFCQPAMILTATALLEENPSPSRDEIKEALAGNLCRCTGYTKILDAVERAARGDVPTAKVIQGPAPAPYRVLGARGRKRDAILKATGQAQYTDDLTLPRMATGKILRSPHAHARITRIDTAAAEALPGVFAVITGADLPTPYGVIPWTPDEQALCTDKVRYIGDGVAAVAARDEATARAALDAIVVEYEVLPAVLDPAKSLDEGAALIHEQDWKDRARTSNLCKEVALSFGEVDKALADAAVVIEDDWHFAGSTHAPIEPHCALASWDPDGQLTVWSSTQVMHYLHRELARVLGLDPAHVRVVQPMLGGAFGGKSEPFDLEFCAALLAKRAGRPVKILYTREEVFYAHRGRHPMDFNFRLACNAQGEITAVDHDVLIDGGAYHSFGLVTTYYAGQLLTGPLRFGSYRFRSRRVYTNKPACGPKRGHGSVQPRFPLETALDEAAVALGMNPMDIRLANAMQGGEHTINGMLLGSCGLTECLQRVRDASEWDARYEHLPTGRGLGVATSMYISGTAYPIYPNKMPQSGVILRADRSGKITLFTGTNDIGQGSDAVLALIVSEETGVPVDAIVVISGDTDLTPVDLGSYSSRVTLMAGAAARDAGRLMRTKMVGAVARLWEVEEDGIAVVDGWYEHTSDATLRVSVAEAMRLAEAEAGTPLVAQGGYETIEAGGDYRGGTIGASPAYSATAHVAEVDVDVETGQVKVLNVWAAHDCGRALHPVNVEGQIEGSVYMGVSEAMFEGMEYREDGLHLGPNLLDYRIATTLDTPEIESMIVEAPDPNGPYGAKEAGEGPLHPAIPAIANAIRHACGAKLRTMPFSPDVVLAALRKAEGDAC